MKQNRKEAIALSYESHKDEAPRVVATGKGLVADNILDRAKENAVPIIEDASLAELLGQLNINETIPEDLYELVAEVFLFIYDVDKRAGSR